MSRRTLLLLVALVGLLVLMVAALDVAGKVFELFDLLP